MVTQIDQRKRRRLLSKILGEACAHLGFEHHSSNYFQRVRGSLQDVFFYQQTRTNGQYDITYGIDCPNLLRDLRASDVLSPSKSPKLLISDVGRLENGRMYGCKYEEHIKSSSEKVSAALTNEAVLWWERFSSETDVIEHYRNKEVRLSEPSDELPPGGIVRWTMYGLLLHDSGKQDQAEIWLHRSLQAWLERDKSTTQDKEWVRIIESRIP